MKRLSATAAQAFLADRGLRATKARRAVLRVFEGARRAMSHAEVEASLREPIDRVTLYRTLDSFVAASILAKKIDADRLSRFVPTQGVDHQRHAHFHCDECSRIFCVEARPPRRPAVPRGFAVMEVDLHLRGRCADCLRDIGPGATPTAPRIRNGRQIGRMR